MDREHRILFLDIDGVLNSVRSIAGGFSPIPNQRRAISSGETEGFSINEFDPVAVHLIQQLGKAGIDIVLSSSWRIQFPHTVIGRVLKLPIIGATPVIGTGRGSEILSWLMKAQEHGLHITQYAIIDDDSDMLDHQLPHFVQTNGFNGIMWENFQRLCEIFELHPFDVVRL